MRRPRPILATALLVTLASLAACGDDGGGDTAQFCELLAATQDPLGDDDLSDPAAAQAAIEQFDELEAAAPEEIRGAVGTLRGVLEELVQVDPDDPESFAAVFSAVLDPEVQSAATELETYARDECGIELDDTSDAGTTPGDDPTAASQEPSGGADGLDISALFAHLDENHGDAPWRQAVIGIAIFNETEVSLDTTLEAGDTATAVEICEAASEYVYGPGNDDPAATTLEVNDAEGEPLAARTGGDAACEAA